MLGHQGGERTERAHEDGASRGEHRGLAQFEGLLAPFYNFQEQEVAAHRAWLDETQETEAEGNVDTGM